MNEKAWIKTLDRAWIVFHDYETTICHRNIENRHCLILTDTHWKLHLQWNSVITNSSWQAIFVRYNRVNFNTQMTKLALRSVRYNQAFVNNRVRYIRASLYFVKVTSFVYSNEKIGFKIYHNGVFVTTEIVITEFHCIMLIWRHGIRHFTLNFGYVTSSVKANAT